MIVKLELSTFTPHIGSTFDVTVQGYDEVLTLIEARPAAHPLPGLERQPFSLLLRGQRTDLYINPGVVPLRHRALGILQLDMSPVGRLPDGTFDYQVGFN